MKVKLFSLCLFSFLLVACVSRVPRDVNNICQVFHEYPSWYRDAKDVEQRWRVPVPVQMAIVHQESKFEGNARPPRTKLFWIFPWKRPTTAYGYAQALNATWQQYKHDSNGGSFWASRTNFAHAVDFIGWYVNQTTRRTGVPRWDAYSQYLAYHEGIGGFMRKSYLRKPWLVHVAHKVKARSLIYQAQLNHCRLG